MKDVFISYSRKDKEFVGQLKNALTATNRDVWVDWEGIPLSADWWREICTGIEAADTFVFVISPDSLASPVCHLEVAHAAAHHKRLLPIVRVTAEEQAAFESLRQRQIDDNLRESLAGRDLQQVARDNWKHLSRHNWLLFSETADFNHSFQDLIKAIETDLDYVREHTRLLIRAREWERKGKNPDTLLMGDELIVAEKWLATAGSKEPRPTALHRSYITDSRTMENRRRGLLRRLRLATGTLAVVGVLALLAAAFSFMQVGDARSEVQSANTQVAVAGETLTPVQPTLNAAFAQVTQINNTLTPIVPTLTAASDQILNANATLTPIAAQIQASEQRIEALRLASTAAEILSQPTGNAESAVLLAMYSLNITYTAQADAALTRGASRLYANRILDTAAATIEEVAYSPDGRWAAIMTPTEILLYDLSLESRSPDQTIKIPNTTLIDIAFTPDSQSLVVSNFNNTIRLLNRVDGSVTRTYSMPDGYAQEIATDGRTILSKSTDEMLRLWNLTTGQQLWELSMPQSHQVAMLPDGRPIIDLGFEVLILNPQNGSIQMRLPIPDNDVAYDVTTSADGTLIAAAGATGAYIWQASTGTLLNDFRGAHRSGMTTLAIAPDNTYLVTGGYDGLLNIWDVQTGQVIVPLSGHSETVNTVAISPDGLTILSGGFDDQPRLWNSQYVPPISSFFYTNGVAYSPDGTLIAIGDNFGSVNLFQLEPEIAYLAYFETGGNFVDWLTFTSDGQQLIVRAGATEMQIWNVSDQRMVSRSPKPDSSPIIYTHRIPGQNTVLFADMDQKISRYNWFSNSWETVREFEYDFYNDIEAISQNYALIANRFDHYVVLYDLNTGAEIFRQQDKQGGLSGYATFSPDEKSVIFVDERGILYQWDTATGDELFSLDGVSYPVRYSDDGEYVYWGSEQGIIQLWRAEDWTPLRQYNIHQSGVTLISISPDHRYLFSAERDQGNLLWNSEVDLQQYITLTCERIVRDLTAEEKVRYGVNRESRVCG